MKSKRRHELHTNLLADWLGEMIGRIKPYQNAILATAILAIVAVVGIVVWHNRSISQAGKAWAAVPLVADSPQPYEQIQQEFPQTPAAEWATVLAADQYLLIGAPGLFQDKALAAEALNHAADDYQRALKESKSPMVQERAAFGLARTQECQGRLDDAAKSYQLVIQRWPKGMFRSAADERLQDLEKPSTKLFYDRFEQFNPKSPALREPGAGEKMDLPPLPENPPEEPKEGGGRKAEGGGRKAEGGGRKAEGGMESKAKTEPAAKSEAPAKTEPAAKSEAPAKTETPAKEEKPGEPKSPQMPEPPAKPESPATK
jgi:predicted negative regulator of RcsB-dependent stress response